MGIILDLTDKLLYISSLNDLIIHLHYMLFILHSSICSNLKQKCRTIITRTTTRCKTSKTSRVKLLTKTLTNTRTSLLFPTSKCTRMSPTSCLKNIKLIFYRSRFLLSKKRRSRQKDNLKRATTTVMCKLKPLPTNIMVFV